MADVVVCECFARDGLQNEPEFLPTDQKVALIDRFATLGFKRVEATSYSNPAVVPQFSDASELLRALPRKPGVFYKATCANVRAVERALADVEAGIGANEISLLVSASEAHSQKNLKRSRNDQWQNVADMALAAQGRFRMIGKISVAFGCPFEGAVAHEAVLRDAAHFFELGVKYVSLGDTTGMASPTVVRKLFRRLMLDVPGLTPIAHFHDSRGTGLANCVAAFDAGVRHFDSAFGGVGGHPAKLKYGGGFTGNVCTEDLVSLFESMGISTGLDLDQLLATSELCEKALGRSLFSRVARTGLNPLRPTAA